MTLLELWGDAVVVASCIAAAIGCFVLNRRVERLASTERGIGKAVSEMARSVGQFEELLVAAEGSTREASTILEEQLAQARRLVARLEMLAGAAPRTAATSKAPPRVGDAGRSAGRRRAEGRRRGRTDRATGRRRDGVE